MEGNRMNLLKHCLLGAAIIVAGHCLYVKAMGLSEEEAPIDFRAKMAQADRNTPEGMRDFYRFWILGMDNAQNRENALDLLNQLNPIKESRFLSDVDKGRAKNVAERVREKFNLNAESSEAQVEAEKKQQVAREPDMKAEQATVVVGIEAFQQARSMLRDWTADLTEAMNKDDAQDAEEVLTLLNEIKESLCLSSKEKMEAIALAKKAQKKFGFPQEEYGTGYYNRDDYKEWMEAMDEIVKRNNEKYDDYLVNKGYAAHLISGFLSIQGSPYLTPSQVRAASGLKERVKKEYGVR